MALKLECPSCQFWNPDGEKTCRKCEAKIPAGAPVRVDEVDGKGKRHRVKSVRRDKAGEIQGEIIAARKKGEPWGDNAEKITLNAVAEKYLKNPTIIAKKDFAVRSNYVNATIRRLGANTRVSSLSPQKIHQYQERRKQEKRTHRSGSILASYVTGSTINRETTYLHGMLAWATRLGIIERNPIAGYSSENENRARDTVLTPDEYKAMHGELAAHCQPIFALRSCLPLRDAETMRLTWNQLHLDAERPYISFSGVGDQATKSGRERIIPIWYAHVLDMLRELPSRFAKGPVFTYQGITDDDPRAFNTWRGAFNTARESFGLGDYRINDLKHDAVTRLIRAGVPLHEIQHAADHSGPFITARYTNIGREAMLNPSKEHYNPATGFIEAVEGWEYDSLGLLMEKRNEGGRSNDT